MTTYPPIDDNNADPWDYMHWEEHKPEHWILSIMGEPTTAFRFESESLHKSRYDWDRKNYKVGMWNAYVKTADGSEHLTWPIGTDIETMKAEVMLKDIRCNP